MFGSLRPSEAFPELSSDGRMEGWTLLVVVSILEKERVEIWNHEYLDAILVIPW